MANLKFLNYNIQAGIGTMRGRDYLLRAHRQFVSVRPKTANLIDIAHFIRKFDVVCLQEVDLGGLRSGYVDQVEFLKKHGEFPYAAKQLNRKLGRLSLHGNAILSKQRITHVESYSLPGAVAGRGLLVATLETTQPCIIATTHFSLGEKDQRLQFEFIYDKLDHRARVVLSGDFNCTHDSPALIDFDDKSVLDMVTEDHHHAFPSWNPSKAIDHIFVSKSFGPVVCEILNFRYSDHLPIYMELDV